MSNYTKTVWVDRSVEYPNRYKVVKEESTGYIHLTQEPGVIGKEGTLVDAEKMNNIENGIANLYEIVSQLNSLSKQVVTSLPSTGEDNIMYLVPSTTSKAQNVYDEYLYINGNWEHIGSTEIDLTNYSQFIEAESEEQALTLSTVNPDIFYYYTEE